MPSINLLNQIYQENNDKDYIQTRGAKTEVFEDLISAIYDKINKESNNVIKILILGVYNGNNDLFPLIKLLKNSNKSFEIWIIDDSIVIESTVNNLINEFSFVKNSDELLSENITIKYLKEDIESFPNYIFKQINSFDIVIAFFVLNHLNNWQLSLDKIACIMKIGAKLYIPEFSNDLIKAIENIKQNNEIFKIINNFHNERYKIFNTTFKNMLLGSDISFIKKYLINNFAIKSIKKISYSIIENNINKRLSSETKHTPIFSGSETVLKKENEEIKETYSDNYLKFINNFNSVNNINNEIKYEASIELFEFIKEKEIQHTYTDWGCNLIRINSLLNYYLKLNENELNKNNIVKYEEIILQLILSHQGIVRNTNFISTLFWQPVEQTNYKHIKFDQNINIASLISTRSFEKSFLNYLIHLIIFRSNDTNKTKRETYSFAELILESGTPDVDWIFLASEEQSGDKFGVELISNSENKYIVFQLPKKYLKVNFDFEIFFENLLNNIIPITQKRYNNFIGIELGNEIKKIENIQKIGIDLDEKIYNYEIINEDKSNRIEILNDFFSNEEVLDIFVDLRIKKNKEDFINKLADRISRFAFLAHQSGASIYIVNSIDNNYGNGGLFFNEKHNSIDIFIKQLKTDNSFTALRYRFLKDVVSIFTKSIILPQFKKNLDNLTKKIYSHAIKAGLAAIMSRNGSHNIGSHILSALSYNINDPADMQVFNKYLQERMDFIAQITTEIPQWTSSMRFINQVMRNFYMQRILLNYIADSEGLSAKEFTGYENESSQKKLQIILVDKKNKPIIPNGKGNGIKNDPLVAIPGGATGVHAFYTILENIIRNVSKHSYKEKNDDGKGLKIFIKFEDGNNNDNVDNVEHLKIIIYDNFTKNEEIEIKKENGGTEKISLKEILENHLYNSFIEEDGSLKYKAWGLAEMKIGAGYLNKKDYSIIGGNEKDKITEFIKIVEVDIEGEKHIGYQIKIPKPKHVLIIDENHKTDENNELKKKGIYFEKTLDENTNLDYEFVVIKNFEGELPDEIINKLPARVFYCNESTKLSQKNFVYIPETTIKELCSNNNYVNLKDKLYQIWVENLIVKKGLNPVHLVIKTTGRSNESVLNHSKLLKFIIKEELTQTGINDRDVTSLTLLLKQDKLSKEPVYNLCNAKIKNRILDKFNFYQDLFKKYEENIETLPLELRHLLEKKDTETVKESDKTTLYSNLKNEKIKISIDNYTNEDLKDSLKNDKKILAYIRHAGFNKKYHYIEALSGSQSYFNEIKNLTEEPDNSLACALIENALLDITLIDERVYKYIEEAGEKVQERFGSIRVSIGNKHSEEMIKLFNEKDKKNLTELSGDILIIHQGILDKFNINNKSGEWETLKRNFKYIFVTSGRGQPEKDKFPGYVKFIPFSNIRASLIKQYPEKFILVQNLLKI